ncbi:MAG: DUF4111 domain-containing protein [Ruminococcaceae bacterium]|nr:DUF4111 domain-containing protein [Oscillospiraceae bacterium]
MNTRAEKLLDNIKKCVKEIFAQELVGVYVHGSLAFGCFHWDRSDIDFLIVTESVPTQAQKEQLIREMLYLDEEAPSKGMEMSVLTRENCRHFVHPMPFELHWSNFHKENFLRDLSGYCHYMQGEDPDLAAHVAVTKAVGFALCGEPIDEVFAEVPKAAYVDSIRCDLAGCLTEIEKAPHYYIPNLCRALAYAEENLILSKEQGLRWAAERLPKRWEYLLQKVLECHYLGTVFGCEQDRETVKVFAEELLRCLKKAGI